MSGNGLVPLPVGMDTSAVRWLNNSAALRTILTLQSPVTLAQLTTATSLSRRTVESILDELIRSKWVEELESRSASGGAGRPSRWFAVKPDNALIAALRIDTFWATAMISDALGTELGHARLELPDYFDPDSSLATAAEALRLAIADSGLPAERLRGGALATGGAVEADGVIRHIIRAPRWSGFDARGALSRYFDVPWFVDNDANLAALAEHWAGSAQDIDSFVWLIFGNRSGAGILIKGEIYSGFRGAAGEIVEASTIDSESYSEHPIAWLTSPRSEQRARALELVAEARSGNLDALAQIDEFIADVTPMVVTIAWTIAPPLIVLGGGLEDAADLLLPRLAASIRDGRAPDIALAATQLGREAPLRGATKLALNRLDAVLFGPTVTGVREARS